MPAVGLPCDIPMWSSSEYVCKEADSVAPSMTYTYMGTTIKKLSDTSKCTLTCPASKWYQQPNTATMTCSSGTYTVDGQQVEKIKCSTSTWVWAVVGIAVAAVLVLIWMCLLNRGKSKSGHQSAPLVDNQAQQQGYDAGNYGQSYAAPYGSEAYSASMQAPPVSQS